MNKSELLQKIAGKQPVTKLADHVQHWGLPKERLFPLDTTRLIKAAAAAFDAQAENMTVPQRLICARNICARADEEGFGVESSLAFKYASSHLSPHFPVFIELRKHATAHVADEELNKLVNMANVFDSRSDVNDRVGGLDKIASALESFDREHGLVGAYGHEFPDAGYTTFSPVADEREDMTPVVKVAGFEVRAEDFDDANWDAVADKLPSEVIDGIRGADDRLAVFNSLPAPEKEIIYQGLFLDG